jgi:hypothetical protein
LWELWVYFLVKNSLQLDPTPRQINPVQAVPVYKFKIYLAHLAIHASVFFPSCCPTKSLHVLLFSPESFKCTARLILNDLMALILVRRENPF